MELYQKVQCHQVIFDPLHLTLFTKLTSVQYYNDAMNKCKTPRPEFAVHIQNGATTLSITTFCLTTLSLTALSTKAYERH
jgi:hypothetical protein